MTKGEVLVAPASLHWEIGNAFSAMLKRGRISDREAQTAVRHYRDIPIRLVDVDLEESVRLSGRLKIYAYDGYMLQCALENNLPLLSLDRGLCDAARRAGVTALEVMP